MSSVDTYAPNLNDGDAELANLVGQLTDRFQAGHVVDKHAYLAAYPHLSEQLEDVWPALEAVCAAAQSPRVSDWTWPSGVESDSDCMAIGDFRIVREIGRGGMGIVYEAEQLSLDRRVALKVLPLAAMFNSRQLDRFKVEAQAAAALHHPNIVPIYFVGCDRAVHFYAMQLVEGPTLAQLIVEMRIAKLTGRKSGNDLGVDIPSAVVDSSGQAAKRRENVRSILQLGIQIADGLDHAHQRGIIHRDIKPSNLIVDADQNVWVTDFGLARIESSPELTMTSDLVGTLRYMSPEQATAQRDVIDHRSDIYSLGTTLYELLTLEPAFVADDRHKLLRQIAVDEPCPPRRIDRTIPDDVEKILLKAMAKDPIDRYETAADLRDDMKRFLEDQPVLARRPSVANRLVKWSRRHRTFLTTSLAGLVILSIVVAAGASFFAVQLKRAHENVQASMTEAEHLAASLSVANGARMAEKGNLFESLAWYAEALHLAPEQDEYAHRLRLATTFRSCPKLIFVGTAEGEVRRAAVGPNGRRVVTTADNGKLQIWDVATGELVQSIEHRDRIEYLQFSPDGHRLVAACYNGDVHVWNCTTGRRTCPVLKHHARVRLAEFSPDGMRIVTVQDGGLARVWAAASGVQIGSDIRHEMPLNKPTRAMFSPDSRRLLTAAFDGSVRVWHAESAEPATPYLSVDHAVVTAAFSPDGSRVLAADLGNVRAWDVATGNVAADLNFAAALPGEAAFSPDGQYLLVAAHHEGSVQLYHLATGEKRLSFAPRGGVADVQFGASSRHFLVRTPLGNVFVWDLASGYASAPEWELEGVVHDLYLQNGQSRALVCRMDGRTQLVDFQAASRTSVDIVDCRDIRDGAFSPDGSYVVTAMSDSTARIWDAKTGKSLGSPLVNRPLIEAVTFGPDGSVLAVGSGVKYISDQEYGQVRIWQTETGQILDTIEHDAAVNSVAFSSDGRRLVTATMAPDSSAYVWDLATQKKAATFPHRGAVCAARFSFDDSLVATASDDRTARIWDARTGQPCTPPLKHKRGVADIVFSPDDRFVATASKDNTARVWDVRSGQPVSPPLVHASRVQHCWFGLDGKHLFTSQSNGKMRQWDFSPDERPTNHLLRAVRLLAETANLSTANPPLFAGDPAGADFTGEFVALRSLYPDRFSSLPSQARSWHMHEAVACRRSHHWSSAIWHLTRVIAAAPDASAAYVLRGQTYEALSLWDAAAADYAAALERHPIEDGVLVEGLRLARGHCLLRSGIETIVPAGSTWRWLHDTNAMDPATIDADFHTTFFRLDFDDTHWELGQDSPGEQGGFGYGDPVLIDIRKPTNQESCAAYFRHTFNTEQPLHDLLLSLQRDDGVIVYLDGKEVARDNMPVAHDPAGKQAFRLYAVGNAYDETILRRIPLAVTLAPGRHVLAISLHNRSPWSGDMRIAEISLAGRPIGDELPPLDDAEALVDRGRALVALGSLDRAAQDFRSAEALGASVPDRFRDAVGTGRQTDR